VRTEWNTSDIWLRRSFEWNESPGGNQRLTIHHDEDAEVYINAVLAAKVSGFTTDYEDVAMSVEANAALKKTGNIIAFHCHQTGGGQYIDVGIARVEPSKNQKKRRLSKPYLFGSILKHQPCAICGTTVS